jgi:hypothetical protein
MISASVITPERRQRRANRNATSSAEIALAQKNQTPAIPSVRMKFVSETGVSMEKLVAAIETPISHQGMWRPPMKNSSTEWLALRVSSMPPAKISAR